MRLAGNWRNLFLWPCSCRVCYMFEVRAPLRLLLFFIFEKKKRFFLLLPSAAALSSSLGAVLSTAPKRPLTFAPRARRSNARFSAPPPPPLHPPSSLPRLPRFLLSTKPSFARQSLNLLPLVVLNASFPHHRRRGRSPTRCSFQVQMKRCSGQERKKRMKRRALKVNCHLLHHLPSAGTWCWSVKLKRSGAGLEIHAASSPRASVSVVFDKNNGRLSEYRPSGSDSECLQDGSPESQTWTFNTPAT